MCKAFYQQVRFFWDTLRIANEPSNLVQRTSCFVRAVYLAMISRANLFLCDLRGHDYVDYSYDTGYAVIDHLECSRCGHTIRHTNY